MKLRLAAVGLLTMLAVASCGKKEEQAADQNTAAATNTTTTAPAASNTTTTAPAASNTTATAPAPAATTNTTNTQQAAATPAASGDKIGNCDLTGKKGETPITPAVAGQLTVETNLPGPGWYNGDTPETIKDGYEYCFAANIAHRAGLDNLKVVNVAWDALVAGQTKDFDLALSQISITDERKKVVDFSVPYFSSDIGVLTKKGASIDQTSIKKAKIGVQQATTGADFVANTLKPETPAKVFPDTPSMFTALQAGQIDVAMTDTSIVLAQAGQSNGQFTVVGQYSTGETYGALFPKGSANEDAINKIIKALQDDGTLKALAAKYLAAAWGTDPTTIPYFKP